jgi:hypothetical protein
MSRRLAVIVLAGMMARWTFPVAARAPIIKSLPVIIIGDMDSGDYDAASGKGILRFKEVLDFSNTAVVDWNNDDSYTPDMFHAYLYGVESSPATTIKPYVEGRIVDTLSAAEYADTLAACDIPATSTEILSWTSPTINNWFLNLFDAGRHPGITDPWHADPATEGETPDANYTKEVTMKLVCGVTSGTVLAASAADLTVRCQSGGPDWIGTEPPENPFPNWTWVTAIGHPAPVAMTPGTGATGMGFIQADPVALGGDGQCAYAGWLSPINIPCTDTETGVVYRATAFLESTSATPTTALGFRLRYHNRGFSNQGFIRFQSAGEPISGDVLNTPTSGNPMTAKLFWACRPDLGEQSNCGCPAMAFPVGDMREYRVCFEMLGLAGEQGTLTLKAISLDRFTRPDAVTPAVSWGAGAGAIAFDSTNGGFSASNDGGWTWAPDTSSCVRTASSVRILLGGSPGQMRYFGVKPAGATGFDAQLHPVSNHLYRFSVTVTCDDPERVPCYRIVTNSLIRLAATPTTNTPRNISWIDWFAFDDTIPDGTKSAYRPIGMTVCPFAPATSGSVIDSYIYSQNVAPASAGTTIFLPILDVIDKGLFGPETRCTAWPDANTPMTYSAASWEDLGTDY